MVVWFLFGEVFSSSGCLAHPLGAWDGLRYFIVALSEPSINHFETENIDFKYLVMVGSSGFCR